MTAATPIAAAGDRLPRGVARTDAEPRPSANSPSSTGGRCEHEHRHVTGGNPIAAATRITARPDRSPDAIDDALFLGEPHDRGHEDDEPQRRPGPCRRPIVPGGKEVPVLHGWLEHDREGRQRRRVEEPVLALGRVGPAQRAAE